MNAKSTAKRALGPRGVRTAALVGYFGTRYRCELCGARTRFRRDEGFGYEMLERLQVVGGLRRNADVCPVCWASSRTRLLYLYLEHETSFLSRPADVLHFAPERILAAKLAPVHGERYVAVDLDPDNYPIGYPVRSANLLELQYDDDAFDLTLCCHVLEHIQQDDVAMGHLYRTLRPGGIGLFQVPLAQRLETTRENLPVADVEERIRLYGQSDHVRVYAEADYVARLERAGFEVDPWLAYEARPDEAHALRIDPFEKLMVCRKPARSGGTS